MSSSSRVIPKVLRGDNVRLTAHLLDLDVPSGRGAEHAAGTDPLAAERAAGYRMGYEAALAEAASGEMANRSARAGRLADALVAAAQAVHLQRQAAVDQAGREAVELAFELAESILGRELSLTPSHTVEALQRALALVPRDQDLVVRLHPGDAITPDEVQDLVKEASVKVVADPEVEEGGCVVEAGPCRIDAQVGPAMARARALIDSVGRSSRETS